ncbi:hypothetical protein [Niastella sp. OAS944]|uniref:hypothetical protein n=1 Tax=Niastella sp. OAS944 TaxID=2664089 RepID=UPI00347C3D1F|nr:hypothetical protein [Chitinophagaceae bacterium OAS944]
MIFAPVSVADLQAFALKIIAKEEDVSSKPEVVLSKHELVLQPKDYFMKKLYQVVQQNAIVFALLNNLVQ